MRNQKHPNYKDIFKKNLLDYPEDHSNQYVDNQKL